MCRQHARANKQKVNPSKRLRAAQVSVGMGNCKGGGGGPGQCAMVSTVLVIARGLAAPK